MSSLCRFISLSLLALLSVTAVAQAIRDKDIDKLLSSKFEKSIPDKSVREKFIRFLKNYPFAGYTTLRYKVDDVLDAVTKEREGKRGASRADIPEPPKGSNQITNNTNYNNMNGNCDCSCKITGSAGACKVPVCPPVPENKDDCAGAPLCDPMCAPDLAVTGKEAEKRIKVQPRVNNGTFIFASLVANLTTDQKLKSEIVGLFGTDLEAFKRMEAKAKTKLYKDMIDIMKHFKLAVPSELERLFKDDGERSRRGVNPWENFTNGANAFSAGANAFTAGVGLVQTILGLCGVTSGQSQPPNITQIVNMNMKNFVNVNFKSECNCKNKCVQWHAMKRCETTCPNNPNCDKWKCVCS